MAEYKIAVIADGNVVKVYSQDEYNQIIIEQYKNSLSGASSANSTSNEIKPIYVEPSTTPKPVTPTYQTSASVGDMVQENAVKPFKDLATSIVLVFVIGVIAIGAYWFKTGNKPSKKLVDGVSFAMFLLIVLVFLQFLKR